MLKRVPEGTRAVKVPHCLDSAAAEHDEHSTTQLTTHNLGVTPAVLTAFMILLHSTQLTNHRVGCWMLPIHADTLTDVGCYTCWRPTMLGRSRFFIAFRLRSEQAFDAGGSIPSKPTNTACTL